MAFDPNIYAQLAAVNPQAAAAYLTAETQSQSPVTGPQSQAQFTPPPPPQAQSQYAPNPQAQAQQPQPEAARGTMEDFYNQPSASNGGKGASQYFGSLQHGNRKPDGSWLQFRVDRDINHNDVSQLTDTNNVLRTWTYGPLAGKPMFQLTVPGTVLASGDGLHTQFFDNGAVRLYLKPGPVTDNFRAALQAGGEDSGFPKAGSVLTMIAAGQKANKGNYSPTMLYDFRYDAPDGTPASVSAAPASAPPPVTQVPPTAPVAPAPLPATAPAPPMATPPLAIDIPPTAAPAAPPAPATVPPVTTAPAPQVAAAPAAAEASDPAANPALAALLSKLQGQAQQ